MARNRFAALIVHDADEGQDLPQAGKEPPVSGTGVATDDGGDAGGGRGEAVAGTHGVEPSGLVAILQTKKLICIDFEATCDELSETHTELLVTRDEQEIIEFPFVVIDVATGTVEHKSQIFVKPERTVITEFCTGLTGITEKSVAQGCSLATAMGRVERYVALAGGEEWCTLVAHGTWDLAVQLRAECHRKGIPLSSWWLRFFDLREVFRWFVGTSSIPTSLLSICRHLGIQLSGRLHSGIDDATTIANAMRKCVGGLLAVKISPRDPFPRPFDLVRDCAAFRAARGTVVRLETLPYDATLANILSWLNENGVPLDPPPRIHRVVYTHTLMASGAAYAELHEHEQAVTLLDAPNLTPMLNKTVFVRPSSGAQLAADRTLPFPPTIDEAEAGGLCFVRIDNIGWATRPPQIEAWSERIADMLPLSLLVSYTIGPSPRPNGVCLVKYPSAVGAARAARKGMSEPLDGRTCRLHIVDEQELAHILRINAWEECTSAHMLIFQGCGVDVSSAAIQKYFSEWGDIMDCCHYVDPVTLKASGCGRIAFKEPARAALVASLDTLPPLGSHNPTVTVIRREFMPQPATVFVRGLKPTTTAQALRRVLGRFGFIIDCVVKQPRCFGFVTFEVPSVADAICAYRPHLEVDGKVVGITMKR
eukprot:m.269262 g.269262  ORF g.269262 m.269262 type:complete len:650 (-) comp16065_c0_seq3:1231-3180(-)